MAVSDRGVHPRRRRRPIPGSADLSHGYSRITASPSRGLAQDRIQCWGAPVPATVTEFQLTCHGSGEGHPSLEACGGQSSRLANYRRASHPGGPPAHGTPSPVAPAERGRRPPTQTRRSSSASVQHMDTVRDAHHATAVADAASGHSRTGLPWNSEAGLNGSALHPGQAAAGHRLAPSGYRREKSISVPDRRLRGQPEVNLPAAPDITRTCDRQPRITTPP